VSVLDSDHPFVRSTARLRPSSAVAALLMVGGLGYLMQLRDPKPEIFYPDHWGLFGGAIEPGEGEAEALLRELHEELALDPARAEVRFFTRMDFDFGFAGFGTMTRAFFEVTVPESCLAGLSLGEGADLRVFTPEEVLRHRQIAPYDAFALWLHINRGRIG